MTRDAGCVVALLVVLASATFVGLALYGLVALVRVLLAVVA